MEYRESIVVACICALCCGLPSVVAFIAICLVLCPAYMLSVVACLVLAALSDSQSAHEACDAHGIYLLPLCWGLSANIYQL